jgi:hypothetical protein
MPPPSSQRRDTPWQVRDVLHGTAADEAALADVAPLVMAQVGRAKTVRAAEMRLMHDTNRVARHVANAGGLVHRP